MAEAEAETKAEDSLDQQHECKANSQPEDPNGRGNLHPDPEVKRASSYRYWVRSSTAPAMAPKAAPPRPLTAAEITTASGMAPPVAVGSQWNRAGTWEEKVLSSWAYNRVRELLPAVEPVQFDSGCYARVVEVTSCSGDASLVTVRQRKRVGYSLGIEMKYAVVLEDEEKPVQGKMKVLEACYGELDDLELEVVTVDDVKEMEKKMKVKQVLTKLLLPRIRGKLEEFEAELKER